MTPTQLAALRAELLTDPENLGYADMAPEQVQIALSGNPVAVTRNVPLDALQAYLMSTVEDGQSVPVWWVLKGAVDSNPVAEMAYDLFTSRLQTLDTTLPTVQHLLGQLVSTGIISQATADAILDMANVNIPRGEALFGGIPSVLDIQFALLD
jgi:hypothetical protein